MFWHEAGQGDTIIFLHGSWHTSSQWLPVIHQLAPRFHCLAPDLLGFGESSSSRKPLSITLQVHALHDLLAALRIQRCVFAAHSLGTWVALQYALHYPQQVGGLALMYPEGLVTQDVRSRWRLERWLTRPLSPLPWLLSATALLPSRLKPKAQTSVWQRYQVLHQSPAASPIIISAAGGGDRR
ncbi:MAG: alpha/beta fold hydrolase [Leptolyngbyaceae cyanobacterium SM2_5_2]|nr:alpha/beta fold hydrolase [Leptolyngbyaceae cyanobacterium SM2_5_2]